MEPLGETQMRKISLVAAIALMLAGVGVWATSTTQARIDVPAGAQINPLLRSRWAQGTCLLTILTITPWCLTIERPAARWRVKPEHGNSSRGYRSC